MSSDHMQGKAEAHEPLFWYRPCGDGLYEGPVHHKSHRGKLLRDEKPGEWVPLFPGSQPKHTAEPVATVAGGDGIPSCIIDQALPPGTKLYGAAQAPAPAPDDKALTQALEERDAASDYIDALLDEVLGKDRHEWTSNYGHADAMAEVRERMATVEGLEKAVAAGFPVVARWTKNAKDGAPRARVWVQFEDGGPEVEFTSDLQAPAVKAEVPDGMVLVSVERLRKVFTLAKMAGDNIVAHSKAGKGMTGWLDDACTYADSAGVEIAAICSTASKPAVQVSGS